MLPIRLNTRHPGPADNKMMRRFEKDMSPENPEQVLKSFVARVPFGPYVASREIPVMALVMASSESKFITGQTHVVEGGMLISYRDVLFIIN